MLQGWKIGGDQVTAIWNVKEGVWVWKKGHIAEGKSNSTRLKLISQWDVKEKNGRREEAHLGNRHMTMGEKRGLKRDSSGFAPTLFLLQKKVLNWQKWKPNNNSPQQETISSCVCVFLRRWRSRVHPANRSICCSRCSSVFVLWNSNWISPSHLRPEFTSRLVLELEDIGPTYTLGVVITSQKHPRRGMWIKISA